MKVIKSESEAHGSVIAKSDVFQTLDGEDLLLIVTCTSYDDDDKKIQI